MNAIPRWMLGYGLFVIILIFACFFVLRVSGIGYEYEWYRNELEQMESIPYESMPDYDQMIYDINLRNSNPNILERFTLDIGFDEPLYIQVIEKVVLILLFALPLIAYYKERARHAVLSASVVAFTVGVLSYNARVMHWYGSYDEMDFVPILVYGAALVGLLVEFLILFLASKTRTIK